MNWMDWMRERENNNKHKNNEKDTYCYYQNQIIWFTYLKNLVSKTNTSTSKKPDNQTELDKNIWEKHHHSLGSYFDPVKQLNLDPAQSTHHLPFSQFEDVDVNKNENNSKCKCDGKCIW